MFGGGLEGVLFGFVWVFVICVVGMWWVWEMITALAGGRGEVV